MGIMQIFDSPKMDSRIKTAGVSTKERWLGYLVGPIGALVFTNIVGIYLQIYYTDIVGATLWCNGLFLTLFPIFSKVLDAVTNLVMGALVERTRTRQGKLRPYILLSAPLMVVSGIMLFAIPQIGQLGQMIWIVISYNLYYSVAFTCYNISHQLKVANATRDNFQRTKFAVFNQIANFAIVGMACTVVFPVVVYPIIPDQ